MIFDISECVDLIPDLYKSTHDFEEGVCKVRLNMPGDGRIPHDLAFSRWIAVEKGVTMLPMSFFYKLGSPETRDNFVRLSIAKLPQSMEKFVSRLKE